MIRLTPFALATALILAPALLVAQVPSPGRSKAADQALAGHTHRTYQQHARDNARVLYYYNQAPPASSVVVEPKTVVTTIEQNLACSDKVLAKLKADFAKNAEIVKQIAKIEAHHAKARESCTMASQTYKQEKPDQNGIANCCTVMWEELTAAEKETEKLLKMLNLEKLDPPKAPAPAQAAR